jgi:hypothetical protein
LPKKKGIFGFFFNFHIYANLCTQEKNAGKDAMAMANSVTKGWVSMECVDHTSFFSYVFSEYCSFSDGPEMVNYSSFR